MSSQGHDEVEAAWIREDLRQLQQAKPRWEASGCRGGYCGCFDCYTCRGPKKAKQSEEEKEEDG